MPPKLFAGTSPAVLLLGRLRDVLTGAELDDCSNGVRGLPAAGVAIGLVEVELSLELSVWYVRTGNLSTTDLGARQRRRRIRDLRSRRAYTTVKVTRGLTTSTSRVSKKGLLDMLVGVRVTQRPSCLSGSASEPA